MFPDDSVNACGFLEQLEMWNLMRILHCCSQQISSGGPCFLLAWKVTGGISWCEFVASSILRDY